MGMRLFSAWMVLVVLTVVSLAVSLNFGPVEGGRVAAAVALAASYLKARAVLDHFMDLRHAGPGWRGVFSGLLLFVLVGLLAAALYSGGHPIP